MHGAAPSAPAHGAVLRQLPLYAAVALLLLLPAFLWSSGYSDSVKYNYIWTSQFAAEMARGHLYPRWLPGSFEGLGSPAFYFYPPLAYWVTGGLGALGVPTRTAINLAAWAALTLSGSTMHRWLAECGTRPRLGAILFMAAPYHLLDFYLRGALAEFIGLLWLPLIALALHRIEQRRGTVLLAVCYAGLILTHLPLAMLATVFLIAPLAIRAVLRDRALLVPLGVAGTLGIALSAFYLLGALTLQGAVSSALLWTPYYRAAAWSLLAPGSFLVSQFGLGLVALAGGIALLVAARARSVWALIALAAALNALGLLPMLWRVQPFAQVQFPWRLLGIAEFAAITALLRPRPSGEPWRAPSPLLVGPGAGLIVFAYALWVPQIAETLRTPVDHGRLARDLPDAPEYLPAGFDTRLVREAGRETDLRAWRDLPRGDTIVVTHPRTMTFRRAAFPIWQVTRNGHVVSYQGPIIHLDAQPGLYRIERRTIWQETVGAAVSLLAALALGVLAFRRRQASGRAATRGRGGLPPAGQPSRWRVRSPSVSSV